MFFFSFFFCRKRCTAQVVFIELRGNYVAAPDGGVPYVAAPDGGVPKLVRATTFKEPMVHPTLADSDEKLRIAGGQVN